MIPLYGCTGTAPTVRINYTANTVTATAPARSLSLSVPSLVNLTVGRPYHGSPVLAGGTPPYTWSISQGTLPALANLSFNTATGEISGTPRYAGTSAFTVTVTDSSTPRQSVSRRITVDVKPSKPPRQWQLCVTNPSNCLPSVGGEVQAITNPHVAFVLVGSWWCTLFSSSTQPSMCKGWTPSTCPGYTSNSCAAEASDFLIALSNMVSKDYSDASPGGYDWGLSNFYKQASCGLATCKAYVGRGLTTRYYAPLGGLLYAGPLEPKMSPTTKRWEIPNLQSTLNGLAGGFGTRNQAEINNTIFVPLMAPNLVACGEGTTANSETGPGRPGLYGNIVWARIYLEDQAPGHQCNGSGVVDSTHPATQATPRQFATFATSHEIDEAITDTNSSPNGWIVPPGEQIADVCQLRNLAGEVFPSLQENNFTRDSRAPLSPHTSTRSPHNVRRQSTRVLRRNDTSTCGSRFGTSVSGAVQPCPRASVRTSRVCDCH